MSNPLRIELLVYCSYNNILLIKMVNIFCMTRINSIVKGNNYRKFLSCELTLHYSFIFASVPIVLVGNKTDLDMDRMVSMETGKRKAEQWNAVFIETTAKNHEVSWVFVVK